MDDMYDPAFPTCDEDSGEGLNVCRTESTTDVAPKSEPIEFRGQVEVGKTVKSEINVEAAMHVTLEEENMTSNDNSSTIEQNDNSDPNLCSKRDVDKLVEAVSDLVTTDSVQSESNRRNDWKHVDINSEQLSTESQEARIVEGSKHGCAVSKEDEKVDNFCKAFPLKPAPFKIELRDSVQVQSGAVNLVSEPSFYEPIVARAFVAGSIPVNRDHSYSRKLKQGCAEKAEVGYSSDNHREDSNESIGSNSCTNVSNIYKKQAETTRKLSNDVQLNIFLPELEKGAMLADKRPTLIPEENITCVKILESVPVLLGETSDSHRSDVEMESVGNAGQIPIPGEITNPPCEDLCPSGDLETKVTMDKTLEVLEKEDSEQKSPKDNSGKKKVRRSMSKVCDQSSSSSTDDVPVRRSSRIRSIEEKKGKEKETKPKKERKNSKLDVKKKVEVKIEKNEGPSVEPSESVDLKSTLDSSQEEAKTISSFKNECRDDSSNGDTNSVASNDSSAVSIPLADTKTLASLTSELKREEDCTLKPEKVKSRWRRCSELERDCTNVIPYSSHVNLLNAIEDKPILSSYPPPKPALHPQITSHVKTEPAVFPLPLLVPTSSLIEDIPLPPPQTFSERLSLLKPPIPSLVKPVTISLPPPVPIAISAIPLPVSLTELPVPVDLSISSPVSAPSTAVPMEIDEAPVSVTMSQFPEPTNLTPFAAAISSIPVPAPTNPVLVQETINPGLYPDSLVSETTIVDLEPKALCSVLQTTSATSATLNPLLVPASLMAGSVPVSTKSVLSPLVLKSIAVAVSPTQPSPKLPAVLPEPDVKHHPFEPIEDNLYLFDRRRSKSKKEVRRMQCDCTLTKEEREEGVLGCTEDCLNRLLMIECGSRCLLSDACSNKRFQKKEHAKTQPFRTEKKGWGLKTIEDLVSGSFVMEYVGEVLSPSDFKQRVKNYARGKNDHYYFMALKGDEIIDATLKGNNSRFINHSCDPNCETQKWTVNGELRIGFFTTKDVKTDDELTFDYQFQRYGREAQRCYCESDNCRGFIGGESRISLKSGKTYTPKKHRSRNTEERKSEDLFLEQEVEKLNGGLKNQEQTLTLARLMVRAEDHETRQRLLDIVQSTTEQACLRLFLDYHGLSLLWSWMVDLGEHSTQLKSQILQILAILPISNKTMLLDSKVIHVVQKWAAQSQRLPAALPTIKSDSSTPESVEPTTSPPILPTSSVSADPSISGDPSVSADPSVSVGPSVSVDPSVNPSVSADPIAGDVSATPATPTDPVTSVSQDSASVPMTVINSENFIIEDLDSIPLPPMPPPPAKTLPKSSTSGGSDSEGICQDPKPETLPTVCGPVESSDTLSGRESSKETILDVADPEFPEKIVAHPDEVADLSEKVADLLEKIADLSGKVSDLPEKVFDLPEMVADLSEEVADLPEKVADPPDKVADLSEKVADLPEKVADHSEKVADPPEKVADLLEKVPDLPEKVAEVPKKALDLPSEGLKKVDENGVPKSDSDESHDTVEEEDGTKNDVSSLAAKILEGWIGLKEVFRIPRLEQEKRKEDERAAQQEQDGTWEGSPPRLNKLDSSPSSSRARKRVKETEGDWIGRNNIRSPLLPTPPKMSKFERRQLFAMEVQQRDQEEAMRRHHEELMTPVPLVDYNGIPIPFAFNPGYPQTVIYDANTGFPIQTDPNTGFPIQTDPNTGFPIQTDPNTGFPIQTDPNTGFPIQTDPNTGFPIQTDPNTGFPIQTIPTSGFPVHTDPNTGYPIQTHPNTAYPIHTDPNMGYQIRTDPNTGYPIQDVSQGYAIQTTIDPNTGFHIQGTLVDPNTGYPTGIPVVNSTTYSVPASEPNAGYALQTVTSSSMVIPPESHLSSTSITSTTVHPGYPPDTHQPLIYQQAPMFQPPTQVSYLPVTSHVIAPPSSGSPLPSNLPAAVPAYIPSASPSLAVGSPLVISSPSLVPASKQVQPATPSPLTVLPAAASATFIPTSATPQFLTSTTQGSTQLYYVQSTGAVVTMPTDQPQLATTVPNAMGPLMHMTVAPSTEEVSPAPLPTPAKPPSKLPPNWRSAKDEEGNVYYYHSLTRETTWDPPFVEDDEEDNESMDLGTPTFDEPKMGIRIKQHASSSSSSSSSSKKKTTTAAADTSSEVAKKIKELFRSKMSGYIVQCLNPFRKPDCKLGRITNTEDFKHLARKLTHFVMSKEIKYCKNVEDLECNENVKHKAKDFVCKYMSKYGAEYRKDKHGSPR